MLVRELYLIGALFLGFQFVTMNYPAASCGVSNTPPKRVRSKLLGINP
jgi:hypothetical protein